MILFGYRNKTFVYNLFFLSAHCYNYTRIFFKYKSFLAVYILFKTVNVIDRDNIFSAWTNEIMRIKLGYKFT